MSKAIKAIGIAAVIAAALGIGGCASCSRDLKSIESDFGGGLHRKVTLYDYDGEVLREWEGKFDVSESETEVYFDLDDKRVIIHGGIVVNEEL